MNFIQQVRDYYPKYLSVHQNKTSRLLHFIGQLVTLATLYCAIFHAIWLLLLVPVVVYPFAWTGHLLFEKNKPATWKVNPLLTKACDWCMFFDILRGKVKIV